MITTVECQICEDRELVLEDRNGSWVATPCICKEQKVLRKMFKNSGLTPKQQEFTMNDYKASQKTSGIVKMIQKYIQQFPDLFAGDQVNKGFALIGSVGIGKTMLAAIVANELLQRKIPVVFVSTANLMGELRSSQFTEGGQDHEEKHKKLVTAPVVIFDDVGKEKPTEFVQFQYFRILDGRYSNRLTTSFTSNFSFEQLAKQFDVHGEAIVSRLFALTRDHQAFVKADDYRISG